MKEVTFIVYGKPRGKARPRMNRRTGSVYTPKATADYEREIRKAYQEAGGGLFDGVPVAIVVDCYFAPNKALSKRQKALIRGKWYTHKPDGDNVLKSVLDALNGVAYKDDAYVVHTSTYKQYAHDDIARIEVSVREVTR